MNELELIYDDKLIKFKYEKTIVLNTNDSDFYSFLIESLKGKNKNSLFNRREIEKNEFDIYEIDGNLTLNDELKYTSKSYILKRIQELIESRKDQYDLIANQINKEFNDIKKELNDFFNVDSSDNPNELPILEIIKKMYNPISLEGLDETKSEAVFYKNIFEYCNKTKSFIIVDLRKSKKDFMSILQMFSLLEQYDNLSLILVENDINNLYNLSFLCNIYLSNLDYKDFNSNMDIFEKDIDTYDVAQIKIMLLNYILLNSNEYEKFLKNININKKVIDYIEKYKNFMNIDTDKTLINKAKSDEIIDK